ncbi:response regulator transcription factor [Sulfurimonas sp.]|nr:response regulator transcription factor [Sulfurimonas sp.]
MKVLLVEDDLQLNKAVETYLKLQKYEVTSNTNGDDAINSIDTTSYDMYILDINLPGVNGIDIIKYIRQKDMHTPIVMITASIEVDNFIKAYDNGCSEYIKKPFHLKELQIRINNLLNKQEDTFVQISNNIIYKNELSELLIDGKNIKLRKKEKKLLYILVNSINHTVTTENIINYVWENEIKDKYPLRQLISELRHKFPANSDFIKTDVGIGYRFEN